MKIKLVEDPMAIEGKPKDRTPLSPLGPGDWAVFIGVTSAFSLFGMQLAYGDSIPKHMIIAIPMWSAGALALTWKRIGRSVWLGMVLGGVGGAALVYGAIVLAGTVRGLLR